MDINLNKVLGFYMKPYQIGDINDKNSFLKKLNVHTKGVDIMSDKMELLYFYIKELKSPAINITPTRCPKHRGRTSNPAGVVLCK